MREPRFDQLLLRLADSVDHPDGLDSTLGELVRYVGAQRAHVLMLDAGAPIYEHQHHLDPSGTVEYVEHYIHHDLRMLAAHGSPGEVLDDVASIDRRSHEHSDLFGRLIQEDNYFTLFGVFPVAGTPLVLGPAFMRGKHAGAYEATNRRRLRRVLPHLSSAMRLRHTLDAMQSELGDLRRALDLLPTGLLIVDGRGRVLCTNTIGAQLLAANDGLCTQSGALCALELSAQTALVAALARLALLADAGSAAEASALPPSLSLIVPRAQRAPLQLKLFALRPDSAVRRQGASARVLIVVHVPEAELPIAPELLRERFALTKTEAQLAAALASGHSLRHYAESHHVSEHTARTHLKHLLEKTRTHRQAELVHLVLSVKHPL